LSNAAELSGAIFQRRVQASIEPRHPSGAQGFPIYGRSVSAGVELKLTCVQVAGQGVQGFKLRDLRFCVPHRTAGSADGSPAGNVNFNLPLQSFCDPKGRAKL
jgi:hypothetical protein